jgi:uncharacterized membrane protein
VLAAAAFTTGLQAAREMDEQKQVEAWVALATFLIVPVWRIVRRTGRHPALSLLMFFPGIGVVLLALILAFGRWPAVQRSANPPE